MTTYKLQALLPDRTAPGGWRWKVAPKPRHIPVADCYYRTLELAREIRAGRKEPGVPYVWHNFFEPRTRVYVRLVPNQGDPR